MDAREGGRKSGTAAAMAPHSALLHAGYGYIKREACMTISVGMGIAAFPFADARGFWRWVDLCEAGGVDSIWQSDRLIGTVPALECISVMAALAGRTRRLKFGMNVLSLAQRDPVLVAKQCATIDVLSEGRLLLARRPGMARARARYPFARQAHGRVFGDRAPAVA
jgi:alkanesulfonate monooxygenase SsuD/methylene tetrahydromethanopterin reductase-like flavin-dependent oxidoreductase (luciferase family)